MRSYSSLEAVEGGLADLAAWCCASDKIKLAELAEMTEGGAHPSPCSRYVDRCTADLESGAFF